jgi:hypothetical protein
MITVTRNQRIYFAAVGLLALWVGIWGFFIPEHVDKAIPWLIPPFHARFIGAIYISAAIIMGSAMLARTHAEVHIATIIATIWTGSLFLISLLYLREFDFSHRPVLFWFGAYILYPLIGLWFLWTHRNIKDESTSPSLPNWIRNYFLIQGVVITVLALGLLIAPEFMVSVWPWKITHMLAQIYSGPFSAFGVGSIMTSRQRTKSEVRIVVLGFFVLAIGVLIASTIHRVLFSESNPATWIWFGGFAFMALILGVMMIRKPPGDSK